MSFAQKLSQKIQETKDLTKKVINETFVETELSKKRMEICLDCPELFHPTKNCKKCGCFMTLKTRLPDMECPLKKW